MQRIKKGAMLACAGAVVYAFISGAVFYYKKKSVDQQLAIQQKAPAGITLQENQDVVVQSIDESASLQSRHVYQHGPEENIDEHFDDHSRELDHVVAVSDDSGSRLLPVPVTSYTISENKIAEEKFVAADQYSFVTMPAQNCVIDRELTHTLEQLIGNDLEKFVRLVLQSNNNIVSKQACRSCALYAFFRNIQQKKPLTVDDIKILQPLIANLYQFVQKMQALSTSKKPILHRHQYEALLELNRSQADQNVRKLQQRKNATRAALKSLQSIQYR